MRKLVAMAMLALLAAPAQSLAQDAAKDYPNAPSTSWCPSRPADPPMSRRVFWRSA
jgi:hypothetical protein